MGSQASESVKQTQLPQSFDLNGIADQVFVCLMESKHLASAYQLEQLCFSSPWSFGMLQQDLEENPLSRYLVLLDRMNPTMVIAYGGYWKVLEEGQITNIAVHPNWRRRKAGTYLLLQMMQLAAAERITAMTLEVRASNEAAQRLYEKLGFAVEGRRKKYYEDNGEDALIMWQRALPMGG